MWELFRACSQVGQFDAVITIFNAVGHLTKQDFKKAIQNIYTNLNDRGLYVFDIYNLNYLLYKDNITKERAQNNFHIWALRLSLD